MQIPKAFNHTARSGGRSHDFTPSDYFSPIDRHMGMSTHNGSAVSDPYVCLWRAVLNQCIIDVSVNITDNNKHGMNRKFNARKVIDYVNGSNNLSDIIEVCEYAQVCPQKFIDRVNSIAADFISNEKAGEGGD